MVMTIVGIVIFFAGIVAMILSKFVLGLILFFAGFCVITGHNSKMLRRSGLNTIGAVFNGFGKGRQQSEFHKEDPVPQGFEDRPSNIWDQVEGK